jgi:hypothetical protein
MLSYDFFRIIRKQVTSLQYYFYYSNNKFVKYFGNEYSKNNENTLTILFEKIVTYENLRKSYYSGHS